MDPNSLNSFGEGYQRNISAKLFQNLASGLGANFHIGKEGNQTAISGKYVLSPNFLIWAWKKFVFKGIVAGQLKNMCVNLFKNRAISMVKNSCQSFHIDI